MTTPSKIKNVHLGKYNNAEYTQFLSYVLDLIKKATIQKLNLTEELLTAFSTNIGLLTDLALQSRVSSETREMVPLDKERTGILTFLLSSFRTEQHNPIAARKHAGNILFDITRPYAKTAQLPKRQKTQLIEGFITDLLKSENVTHLDTLGLKEAVISLKTINLRYKELTAMRADSQLEHLQYQTKTLRKETDGIYDELITRAFVASVATPSDEATAFVHSMNKLITDTDGAYKQRLALQKSKSNEPSGNATANPSDGHPI